MESRLKDRWIIEFDVMGVKEQSIGNLFAINSMAWFYYVSKHTHYFNVKVYLIYYKILQNI